MLFALFKQILRSRAGLSLTETIMTVAILGIFATGVVATGTSAMKDANITKAKEDMSQIRTAIITYESYTGNLPTPGALLTTFTCLEGKTRGPLLRQVGWTSTVTTWKDPWGGNYNFTTTAASGTHPIRSIFSPGPDKTLNNADDLEIYY